MAFIEHPDYYYGNGYDVNDIVKDYGLNFWLGNVIKYVCRAGKKNPNTCIDDLLKAKEYLEYMIQLQKEYEEKCTH